MMNVSLLSMAVTMAFGVILGKAVEDDPDNWLLNFAYAVNTGVMSERVSQLPFGVTISMIELIRSVAVSKALYDDLGSILDVVVDIGQYYAYVNGLINTEPYNKIEKRGGYTGIRNWLKDAFKAGSVLFPEININNVFKNFSNAANISSANFYNEQLPVNWLNYIPRRGDNKEPKNIITWLTGYSKY